MDQKDSCPYSGSDTNVPNWVSRFDHNRHYKEIICSCGHKVSIKTEYMSCGEDHWNNNLDNLVEKVNTELQNK